MPTLATQVIDGLARLTVTQGEGAGGPFVVLPWQKRFLRGALRPETFIAALSIARGNGKTTLASALTLAALTGPLARPRGEVVLVASSFTQARIALEHTRAFMADALEAEPRCWRVVDNQNTALIEDKATGGWIRAIGSDPKRAHGLAPVLVVADEPAQWLPNKSEAMYAALDTGLGKIDGSRLIAIGTKPVDPGHWFNRLLNGEADYSQVHSARPSDPPFHRRTWKRANPSLDAMPQLERVIRRHSERARLDPAQLASFGAYRLNRGIDDTTRAMLIDAEVWAESESDDAGKDGPVAWGIDLGTSAAQSAVSAYWPTTGRLEAVAVFPELSWTV